MTISKALLATINTEMEGVEKYRDINMSFANYTNEYSRLMGQISVDKRALLAAKMPSELFEKYPAYLYVMTEEHAFRKINERTGSEASKEFDTAMPAAEEYRDSLIVIADFIMGELKDPLVDATYRQIFDGHCPMSKLNDIIGLTSFLENYLDSFSEIALPGIEMNQEYLDRARAEAHRLMDLLGKSKTTITEKARFIDRQNRILTLARDAEDKIKRYAKAAFFRKKEYYDEHYVNHYFREKYRKRQKAEKRAATADTTTIQLELEEGLMFDI